MLNSKELLVLIEDEELLGEGLVYNFEAEGFQVRWFREGASAFDFITQRHRDISAIVLDIMLPGMNGMDILQKTRTFADQVPIAVLSAKSLESDKLTAFELGADDYITKPFGLAELLMRIKILIKKSNWYQTKTEKTRIAAGHAVFIPEHFIVEGPGSQSTRLSPTEALLLKIFLDNPNKLFSRAELLEKVWNQQKSVQTRTVDVFVSKLRKIIEPNPAQPQFLVAQRSLGYIFVTDEKLRRQMEKGE